MQLRALTPNTKQTTTSMTSRFALARSSVACAQSYEQGLAQVGAPPQFVFDCGHNATDQERRTPEGKLSNGGKASGSLINVHADAWKVVFPCQVARDCVPCAYTVNSNPTRQMNRRHLEASHVQSRNIVRCVKSLSPLITRAFRYLPLASGKLLC